MKQNDKISVVAITVWTFIHTYLLLKNIGAKVLIMDETDVSITYVRPTDYFYPFIPEAIRDVGFYDYSEYFVYVVGAWGFFFLRNF